MRGGGRCPSAERETARDDADENRLRLKNSQGHVPSPAVETMGDR
jgi:hypothetical protein